MKSAHKETSFRSFAELYFSPNSDRKSLILAGEQNVHPRDACNQIPVVLATVPTYFNPNPATVTAFRKLHSPVVYVFVRVFNEG